MIFKKSRVYQGFTLIELIVVIVVIGILAAFVTISYFGISEKARRNSLAFNTQSILRTIKVKKLTDDSFVATDIDASNLTSQLGMNADNYSEILISYTTDDYAYVVGQKTFSDLIACGTQDNIKVYGADDAECPLGGSPYSVEKVTDTIGLDGTGTCSSDPYLIESIEDLVTFSNTVNGIGVTANNFSGKCVMLMASLDFQQSKSYINADGTDFGDVNGNGTVEGLKKELTTGQGFNPIGDYLTTSRYFAGTLRGNKRNIYNLLINRPTTNYIGLFGYLKNGTITNTTLTSINITGGNYAGGFTGYNNNGNITNSSVSGDVIGANYTGLCSGYFNANSGVFMINLIASGNVTGSDYVGGLVGRAYDAHTSNTNVNFLRGLYKGGAIIATGSRVGRITGESAKYNYNPVSISSLSMANITVNGLTKTSNDQTSIQGASIDNLSDLHDINIAEVSFDTYIGGDNDADGDYWYADASGNILRSSVDSYPISFGLSGAGTLAEPYLISSYDDLIDAQIKPGSIYKLTSNINLSGRPNLMLGSHINPFTGTLLGNNKIISNYTIDLSKISYVGLVSENMGTIKDLTLNNATISGGNYTGLIGGANSGTINNITSNNIAITGSNYSGGIAGYSSGTMNEIQLDNLTLTGGTNYTGGLSGYNNNTSNSNIIINGNVNGTNYVALAVGYDHTSSGDNLTSVLVGGNVSGTNNVGGIVGYAYDSHCANEYANFIKGVHKGGSITSSGSNRGRIVGGLGTYCYHPPGIDASALSTTTINGSTVISSDPTSKNGLDITSSDLSNSATYTARGFNFTDEALDYIWYIDGSVAKFREGTL